MMTTIQETYPAVSGYLADYNFALEQGRELPAMSDARLTPAEQARIGRFLLKADPRGRTEQRHYRHLEQGAPTPVVRGQN